jgi:hypothetical protein
MINLGLSIEEIEDYSEQFIKDYDYEGKPLADYYEQKFKIYLAIAESELYTDEERKKAFQSAYQQVQTMKTQKVNYFLLDSYYRDLKLKFIELCKKYNFEVNITLGPKEKETDKKPKMSEEEFNDEVNEAETKQKVIGLYKRLGNYKNHILLTQYESWKNLINKTFETYGNIKLFLKLLEENHYPHTDFWTANSKYFHFGLAVALSNINTKQETIKYLSRNTGHGGFVNIMKALSVNKDKEMCLQLFERYLKFCDLLVN